MSSKNVLVFLLAIIAISAVAFVVMGKPVEAPANVVPEDASDTETVSDETDILSISNDAEVPGWVRVTANAFTLDVPSSWIVEPRPPTWGDDRIRGIYTYGWLYSERPDQAYTDPDVVTVMIDDITYEEGRTYDGVVAQYAYTEAQRQSLSDALKEAFNDPDNAPSYDEIQYAETRMSLDGRPATRILFGSEKPLYIEGGAETSERYIIDNGDHAFVLTISAASTQNLDVFLDIGRSVVNTFDIK